MNRMIFLIVPAALVFINIVCLYFINKIFRNKCKEANDLYNDNERLENKVEFLRDRLNEHVKKIETLNVKIGKYNNDRGLFFNGKPARLNVPISTIREKSEIYGDMK